MEKRKKTIYKKQQLKIGKIKFNLEPIYINKNYITTNLKLNLNPTLKLNDNTLTYKSLIILLFIIILFLYLLSSSLFVSYNHINNIYIDTIIPILFPDSDITYLTLIKNFLTSLKLI